VRLELKAKGGLDDGDPPPAYLSSRPLFYATQ
jgi:hypothetical protein